MIYHASSYRKILSGLMLMLLSASTAYSVEYIGVTCIDIASTPTATRALELAITTVNEKYVSLAGTHKNKTGTTVGSAVGTASLMGDDLIATVNASYAVDSTMEATLYQFNFDTAENTGTFQSITQQSINGTMTPTNYKSGGAALVACNAPLTVFSGSTPPPTDPPPVTPPPTSNEEEGCYDNDKDFTACISAGGPDCNDNDPTISPLKPEICGDGIDQNCNGIIDDPTVCGGGSTGGGDDGGTTGYPTFTSNNNGTLSQVGTNLVWQQQHYEPTQIINWHGATDYCGKLTLGGATNWRLPTRSELEGIVDGRKSPVTIDPLFIGTRATYYWTSTDSSTKLPSTAPTTSSVYNVHFGTGVTSVNASQSTTGLTRCVHN